jgi:hypothetical protein
MVIDISFTARIARRFQELHSPLQSGSQLVSTIATIGIPSFLASATAILSLRGSTMKIAPAASSYP